MMTRKEFLKAMGKGVPLFLCAYSGIGCSGKPQAQADCGGQDISGTIFKGDAPAKPWKWSIEAFHYARDGQNVQCQVCPNRCFLAPGDRSVCRSRVNINGKLYSLAYGNPCSVHIDPIEKKPLNHFYPGTSIFSIATTGCNLRCLNCQNWEISQQRPEDVEHTELFPADVVREARASQTPAIAYTYSEAVTYYEYMFDTSKLAKEAGLKNVWVSNGYINHEPLLKLSRYLDGANVNLKSFEDSIYRCLNGGRLQPILETFKTLHEEGIWFEMTTLVVPTYVDNSDMIKRMCGWILKELGPDHPLHFSRFFPQYKLTRLPPTPVEILDQFRKLALQEGIRYVYVGNVPGHEGCHTYCHNCKKLLVERNGYVLTQMNITGGKCKFCKTIIPGRWASV
jgi:pyruvate formate lyase activating enzyme